MRARWPTPFALLQRTISARTEARPLLKELMEELDPGVHAIVERVPPAVAAEQGGQRLLSTSAADNDVALGVVHGVVADGPG